MSKWDTPRGQLVHGERVLCSRTTARSGHLRTQAGVARSQFGSDCPRPLSDSMPKAPQVPVNNGFEHLLSGARVPRTTLLPAPPSPRGLGQPQQDGPLDVWCDARRTAQLGRGVARCLPIAHSTRLPGRGMVFGTRNANSAR